MRELIANASRRSRRFRCNHPPHLTRSCAQEHPNGEFCSWAFQRLMLGVENVRVTALRNPVVCSHRKCLLLGIGYPCKNCSGRLFSFWAKKGHESLIPIPFVSLLIIRNTHVLYDFFSMKYFVVISTAETIFWVCHHKMFSQIFCGSN